MNEPPDQTRRDTPRDDSVPVPGPLVAAGLAVSAAAMLGAATLGWAGVAVLVAFLAGGCALLLRWAR
jgi:hypothetical protein